MRGMMRVSLGLPLLSTNVWRNKGTMSSVPQPMGMSPAVDAKADQGDNDDAHHDVESRFGLSGHGGLLPLGYGLATAERRDNRSMGPRLSERRTGPLT